MNKTTLVQEVEEQAIHDGEVQAEQYEVEEYSGPVPTADGKMEAIASKQGDALSSVMDPAPPPDPVVADAVAKHQESASGLDMNEIMKNFKPAVKSKGPYPSLALAQDMSKFRSWLKDVESRVQALAETSAYPTDDDHQRAFDLLKSEFEGHLRTASKHSAIYRNRLTQGRVGSNPNRFLSGEGDVVGSTRVNAPQSPQVMPYEPADTPDPVNPPK